MSDSPLRVLATEQIYDAAFDDEAFARLPSLLAELIDARSASFAWRYRAGGTVIARHNGYFSETDIVRYEADYAQSDPWVPVACSPTSNGSVILMDEKVDAASVRQTRFYDEWLRGIGDDSIHCVAAAIETAGGQGIVGLIRGPSRFGAFNREEAKRLETVIPHLSRALMVREKLGEQSRRTKWIESALDATGYAMITVEAGGRIHSSNAAADAMLRRGRLRTRDYGSAIVFDGELANLVACATARAMPTANMAMIPMGDQTHIVVSVTPCPGEFGRRLALLLFREEVAQCERADALRKLFSLTAAEAKVALLLAQGHSPAEIATRRGTSIQTIRSQVRTIKSKTHCSRHAELSALISNIPIHQGQRLG